MYCLRTIQIKGFRNFLKQEATFHPRLNFVCGDNAQGKTSLLEAIFFLAVTRSFRTKIDHELINLSGDFFYLSGSFLKQGLETFVQVSCPAAGRVEVKINKQMKGRFDNIHDHPVVVFSPEDLAIIRDGPSVRRRFINLEASRINPLYLQDLRGYQRVLNHRNFLLKEKKNRGELEKALDPWDRSLAAYGVALIGARIELIAALEERATGFFSELTAEKESIKLNYCSNVAYDHNQEEMIRLFLQRLQLTRDQESRRGQTLSGPHLDDLQILIGGMDTRRFSSQGQKRAAALALKMSVAQIFEEKSGATPIILLDDVFSEFDKITHNRLLEYVSAYEGQCFITSAAGPLKLPQKGNGDYKSMVVEGGRITSETAGLPG